MRHRERVVGDDDPGTGSVATPPNAGAHPSPNPAAELAQIIDHSPDAIVVHRDGHIVFVNAVAARWLGARSAQDLLGLAVSRIVHATSLPHVLARAANLHRTGDVSTTLRATVLRLQGDPVHVDVVSVLTDWHGTTAYQLILRDRTERRAVHDVLAHRAALVDHAGDAIIAVTAAGMVTGWNRAAERIYGRPAPRALALPIAAAVGAPVDLAGITGRGGNAHATHYAMDGTARAVRLSVSRYPNGYVLLCSDETLLRRTARNLRTVVNTLQIGVLVVDRSGWLLTVNPTARQLIGLSPGEIGADHGEQLRELAVYDANGVPLPYRDRPIPQTFATGLPTIGRVLGIDRPDGRRIWLSSSVQLLHPDSAEDSPALVSFIDITSQRATTEHLAFRAAHDALTGLPNRTHILETIDTLHHRAGALRALLLIDLDDLKSVNDTFGHDVGDLVLRATAARLGKALRRNDIVGRLAGDEFVALLVGELRHHALDDFVDRIRYVLAEPIRIPGGTLRLGASIGVVDIRRGDARDGATLLRDADAAMYLDKASGRQSSVFARD